MQTKPEKFWRQNSKTHAYSSKLLHETLSSGNEAELVIIDEAAEWTAEEYEKVVKKLLVPVREDRIGVSKHVAEAVIERARGKCEQCDRGAGSGVPLQISHTIARGMGGTHGERSHFINSTENLKYLCEICHRMLFHHEVVRYNPGQPNEQSCRTCWLKDTCIEVAYIRGILPEP